MKRFSIANAFWNRIAQEEEEQVRPMSEEERHSDTVVFNGEKYSGEFTKEQQQRIIPWAEDSRFKYDPKTGAVLHGGFPLTAEEVKEFQAGWPREEKVDKEVREIGKKLGIEATTINQIILPIAEKYFDTIGPNEITKQGTTQYVIGFFTKMGASPELIADASEYLDNIFHSIRLLERTEHTMENQRRRPRSMKTFAHKNINAVVLAAFYNAMVRKGQTEEETPLTPAELRTMKRLQRVWATDELKRIRSGQTPEQFYGIQEAQGFPVLTKETAEQILRETIEPEELVIPIEEVRQQEEHIAPLPASEMEQEHEQEIETEVENELENRDVQEEQQLVHNLVETPEENEAEVEEEEDELYLTKREQDEIEGFETEGSLKGQKVRRIKIAQIIKLEEK